MLEVKIQETKKITVINNASLLYDEMISIYMKKNGQTFKSRDKEQRLKYNYDNLIDLDYQPNQLQPEQLMLPKWLKVSTE